MTTYELAQKYYPRLWDDRRIDALVAAGKLTAKEAAEIKEGKVYRSGQDGNVEATGDAQDTRAVPEYSETSEAQEDPKEAQEEVPTTEGVVDDVE